LAGVGRPTGLDASRTRRFVVAEVIEISPIDFVVWSIVSVRTILEAMHGLYDDALLRVLEAAADALIQGLDSYSKQAPGLLLRCPLLAGGRLLAACCG
jgi:hypothetical protein